MKESSMKRQHDKDTAQEIMTRSATKRQRLADKEITPQNSNLADRIMQGKSEPVRFLPNNNEVVLPPTREMPDLPSTPSESRANAYIDEIVVTTSRSRRCLRDATQSEPDRVDNEAQSVETSSKRQQRTTRKETTNSGTPKASTYHDELFHDAEGDRHFAMSVLSDLKAQAGSKTASFGRRQAKRISALLAIASPPTRSEALFLSGEEAKHYLQPGKFHNGPIFTSNQQPLPLQSIEQFLGEFYDDESRVWIQDPCARDARLARQVPIGLIKERFKEQGQGGPWNCLEMATHVEDGLRPAFLNGEDCRLLTKLKIPTSHDQVSRRRYEPGYKEVEKWALLAEAGALTEPHQDSHGYSTYITVNVALVGFGWLSFPSTRDRKAWCADPQEYTGGRWRYVVLKPGQTVFFPAGTVHFVFRSASEGNTLAFGGHVLRCSTIVHWVKILLEERASPEVTNEDLSVSSTGYLAQVARYVAQAQGSGESRDLDRWGGRKAIKDFLRLRLEFLDA